MDLKLNFLIQAVISFWVIAFLSFLTVSNMTAGRVMYFPDQESVYVSPPVGGGAEVFSQNAAINAAGFLLAFFIVTLFMLLFLRVFKGRLLFEILFSGAIIFGAQKSLEIYFQKNEAFVFAIGVVALRFIFPRIWTQNLAVILGISGIAADLGVSIKPSMAVAILILLSIYDIIAVYKTCHMVNLFKSMAQKGAVLALIVPKNFSLWLEKLDISKPNKHNEFIFLGTGDLALPLFFAVSVFSAGHLFYVSIITGATIGLLIDHIYFINQKQKKPIPALPAIAFFSIVGYVAASLLTHI